LRKIVNVVRGKNCDEVLYLLKALPQKGARIVEKLVKSAVANAKNNSRQDPHKLIVAEIFVDSAGMLKRFRAQSRGRGAPIKKRLSHVTIEVREKQ